MKISKFFFIIIFILISRITFSQELIWKHTGGPMGGVVGDVAINSKDIIFAGAYPFMVNTSGLYKSSDNGSSWNKIETQFDDFAVYSIYITKNDHIWVGTDFQDRIYLSTNNGESWEIRSNGYNTNECWAFGESNDGILFAGDGQYNKLFRSTNYGENWELSANLRPLAFATDSNNIIYTGTFTGLYKTTDNGITWTQDNFLQNIPVASIIIDEKNNIYCGTGYYDSGDGIYYSDNGGQSWIQIGLAGKVVLSLAFDSERNLYAGTLTDGLFKTTDLGQNWVQYQNGIYRKWVYRLKINKQDDVFVGSEGGGAGWLAYGGGGVFRSTNGGNSFEHIGLPASLVRNIEFSGDSLIIVATQSGVQSYNLITRKWNNLGLHNVEAVTITPSDFLYAATRDEGLFKSTDLGKTWTLTNLTSDTLFPVFNVLAKSTDTVFAATGLGFNLRRTFDGGQTWERLSVKTGEWEKGLSIFNDILLAIGYNLNNILYKSDDFGSSFVPLYSGFSSTNDAVRPICAVDSNYFFLALLGNNPNGIIRSTNGGSNWQQILTDKRVSTVFANDNGLVITGSLVTSVFDTNKVFISNDFGNSWTIFTQPTRWAIYLSDIRQSPTGKYFLGTSGEGLFEVDIPTSIEDELNIIPGEYLLFQNYPNPFNPTTHFKFRIADFGFVSLKVYDILGNEVATLVNEFKPAGEYEVSFDGKELPSGIYIYTLRAGNFSDSKKMLLLK
jgi:photosystem II stability/assembly factor-like uncharacterized protein